MKALKSMAVTLGLVVGVLAVSVLMYPAGEDGSLPIPGEFAVIGDDDPVSIPAGTGAAVQALLDQDSAAFAGASAAAQRAARGLFDAVLEGASVGYADTAKQAMAHRAAIREYAEGLRREGDVHDER